MWTIETKKTDGTCADWECAKCFLHTCKFETPFLTRLCSECRHTQNNFKNEVEKRINENKKTTY